jgi:hypothetical protein
MPNREIFAWHSLLPPETVRQAYRSYEEMAWPRPDAEQVINLLQAEGYKIVSIDTWLPTTPGPTPLIRDWDGTRAISALDFVKTFDPENKLGENLGLETYFNIDAERA